MNRLAILVSFLTVAAVFATSPLMRRGAAPELSATEAIRVATSAMESRGPQYYCGEVRLVDMVPTVSDQRFTERHWYLVFYDSQRERGVEPDGRETYGDIALRVSLKGEVFDIKQLFFGSPKPAAN